MKKTLSIVLLVLLVFLAVACSPEHKHDYQLVESKTVKATCESGGYDYMECSCGAIQSIPTGALGHDPVEDKNQYEAATCKKTGKKVSYCSRCNTELTVILPVDSDAHPFKTGLFPNLNTATISVWPTCGSDGKATFKKCNVCEKEIDFETTLPKEIWTKDYTGEESLHVELTEKSSDYTSYTDVAKAVVAVKATDIKEYKTTDEATAFSEGKKVAVCPICDEKISEQQIAAKTIDANKSAAIGNWTYFDIDDQNSETFTKNWLEINKKNGFYSVIGYTMKSAEGVIESAKTEKVDTLTLGFANLESTGVQDLVLATNDSTGKDIKVSDAVVLKNAAVITVKNDTTAEVYVLTVAKSGVKDLFEKDDFVLMNITTSSGLPEDLSGSWTGAALKTNGITNKTAVVAAKENHLHSMVLMSDRRAVGDNAHYLGCECGLCYIPESHTDGCEICGLDKEKWFKATIEIGSTVNETFWLPSGSSVYIPSGTSSGTSYVSFLGNKGKYTAVTSKNGSNSKSTSTTFFCDDGGEMTLVLEEKQ